MLNEKGIQVVAAMMSMVIGILVFIAWIQIFIPLTNDILYPILDNTDNAVPYAAWIKALIQLIPLVLAITVLIGPFVKQEEIQQSY